MKKFKVWLDSELTLGWSVHSILYDEEEAYQLCEDLNQDRSYSYVEEVGDES